MELHLLKDTPGLEIHFSEVFLVLTSIMQMYSLRVMLLCAMIQIQ